MFLPVTLPAEMAAWDKAAMDFGLSGALLMENAARQTFAVLRQSYGGLSGKTVLILAGAGNNGGDGFCLARLLVDAGARPLIACTRSPDKYTGHSAHNLQLAKRLDIEFIDLAQIENIFPDIVIDGILGTGFSGELRQPELGLVEQVNRLAGRAFILALDIPSGLDALSGRPCPTAVRADLTVSFQAAKPGLLLPQARQFIGELLIAPIGIPRKIQRVLPASFRLWNGNRQLGAMDAYRINDILRPEPQADPSFRRPQHKGQAGKVLILGGSANLNGAPQLAGRAAFRAGAGLVCLGGPGPAPQAPEFISLPLEESPDGHEWPSALPRSLQKEINTSAALLIGPGMGRLNGASEFLDSLLSQPARPPLVLDADALAALAGRDDLLGKLHWGDILTPHPGEAAAILGWNTAQVQADRFAALAALAAKAEAVWILKGECTLIHSPGRPVTICPFVAPNLAVAGSGDVLAGLICALRAAGMSGEAAAVVGAHAHGLAGLLLAEQYPNRGNLPQEIADHLPQALARLDLSCLYPHVPPQAQPEGPHE